MRSLVGISPLVGIILPAKPASHAADLCIPPSCRIIECGLLPIVPPRRVETAMNKAANGSSTLSTLSDPSHPVC